MAFWTKRAHITCDLGFSGNHIVYHPDGDLEKYLYPGQKGYVEQDEG